MGHISVQKQKGGITRNLLKILLEVTRLDSPNFCRNDGEEWSQWSGLNRRPTVYETVALPLSYIGFQ